LIRPPATCSAPIDSASGRVFGLVADSNGIVVQSYDVNTFTPISGIPLYGLNFPLNGGIRLVRWGTNGLATITDDGYVVLIDGAFVAP
jgi:hypothetical protein